MTKIEKCPVCGNDKLHQNIPIISKCINCGLSVKYWPEILKLRRENQWYEEFCYIIIKKVKDLEKTL